MTPPNAFPSFELTKEEFEILLHPQLGSDVRVKDFETRPLTQPGENYGSTILAAELNIQHGNKESTLHLVVKLVPPSEFLRETFDIEVTFNKEVNAYRLVSPEYETLQREKRVPCNKFLDVFPKFYGARTNKIGDENERADDTAVLLLENLKLSGYHTGDRLEGLDLQHMELGVAQLARFHAISIALKIQKPEVFRETVLKACERFVLDGISNDDVVENIIVSTLDDIKSVPECSPYLKRIEMALVEDMKVKKLPSPPLPEEPFATFIHNDFWVNNMMFRYEDVGDSGRRGRPISMKFVDFQTTLYASPVHDVIFFMYSSAADGVIDQHYDHLIRIYHQELMDCLRDLECNTEPFSWENFQTELNTYGPKEFVHILCMIKFISADKNKVPDLSQCDLDVIVRNNYGGNLSPLSWY
ncbi:uncharacterized protein [Periplaneta americana]|uniref:uncharacterized protein isoform X2 n=1 Tax=Periplaneta americana TaxID=6978 RepID=UPI0037E875B0